MTRWCTLWHSSWCLGVAPINAVIVFRILPIHSKNNPKDLAPPPQAVNVLNLSWTSTSFWVSIVVVWQWSLCFWKYVKRQNWHWGQWQSNDPVSEQTCHLNASGTSVPAKNFECWRYDKVRFCCCCMADKWGILLQFFVRTVLQVLPLLVATLASGIKTASSRKNNTARNTKSKMHPIWRTRC